jgi:membrane protein
MIALAAVVIAPIVFSAFGLSSLWSLAIAFQWPLLLAMAAIALAAIYRWAKPRRSPLAMAFGRERGSSHRMADHSALFSWYIAHFGAYNATHGSLGAAVGMMMWMWILPS